MPTLTSSSAVNIFNGAAASAGMRHQNQRNRMSKAIPFIPVKIDDRSIQSGAKQVLSIVRPQWNKYNESKIKSKVFTEGLSNKLVGFFVEDNKEDIVIVKVFGTNTDSMIDRQAEIATMKLLHSRDCGAELYATFDNGICYQYMNGNILEVDDCQDPTIFPLVAAEMAKMHWQFETDLLTIQKESNGDNHHSNHLLHNNNHKKSLYLQNNQVHSQYPKSQIWNKLRQFNKLAEEIMTNDAEFRKRMEKVGVVPGWGAGAIADLESIFTAYPDIPVTFCHNDLLPRNIVFDEKRRKITFIDVEYAMYNYCAFDVANHFLEFAGVDEIDYTKYPNQAFRYRWLREYLKHVNVDGDRISVEDFDFWVQLCVPISHLLWGLWGISQVKHSTIEFDYYGYVGLRLSEFKKHMEKLQHLKEANKSTVP